MTHRLANLPAIFDYIIVGAGSAGCVLANRLSSDPEKTVCLVEAGGPDDTPRIHIPAGTIALHASPKYGYQYYSSPQANLGGRKVHVPRGKGLGGSSSMNSMVYIRGHRSDYDRWAEFGCVGWGFDDVLPYFKRSERNLLGQDPELHGTAGELLVDRPRDPNPFSKHFVTAAAGANLKENKDFNGSELEGAGIYNVTQDRGRRLSSYRAFVYPIRSRSNLFVLTDCSVSSITIKDRCATDIVVERNGERFPLAARGEIILCTGSIGSPEILMKSGIGDAAHLQELGIKVQHDLPGVGRNLQEHFGARISYKSRHRDTLGFSLRSLDHVLGAPFKYLLARRGWLTTNYVEAGGFACTKYSNGVPDVQFHFVPGYRSNNAKIYERGHGFSMHTCVLRPKSRGRITLERQADKLGTVIDFNFLDDPMDADVLLEGLRLARTILNAPPFSGFERQEVSPGPDVVTDEALLDYARATGSTVFHPAGTCRMGTAEDAVVTPSLKVVGIDRLRVADVSIMPTLVSGNTNAPAIMIGEKCADLVKQEAR